MALLRTFSNEIEAEMAMSALEAAGIQSAMTRDDCGGIQPAMGLTGGIQVIVDDENIEAATATLPDAIKLRIASGLLQQLMASGYITEIAFRPDGSMRIGVKA
jgi:hypothetical protein